MGDNSCNQTHTAKLINLELMLEKTSEPGMRLSVYFSNDTEANTEIDLHSTQSYTGKIHFASSPSTSPLQLHQLLRRVFKCPPLHIAVTTSLETPRILVGKPRTRLSVAHSFHAQMFAHT